MPSLLSIYNKALAHVGAGRLTSVDDENNRAEVCNDMYEFALDACLEAREWSFATRRIKALPNQLATPPWGFNFAYNLPNQFISILEVRNGRNNDVIWVVEGDHIFATEHAVDIRYVTRVTDTNKFTATFVNALAYKLAAEICIPLTENSALFDKLELRYQNEINRAGALDGLQASRERLKCGKLIEVRHSAITGDCSDPYQDGTGEVGESPEGPEGIAPDGIIFGPTSALDGAPATYTSSVTGSTPIAYQWFLNGVAIAGATQSAYSIDAAELSDAGSYQCRFTNEFGSSTSNVIILEIGCFDPVISISPPNVVSNEGEDFTLTATILAGNEPISLQWQKDEVDLVGETGLTLEITGSETGDEGSYRVLGSNECADDVPSNVVTVTVVEDLPPTISIAPIDPTVIEGETVLFTVTVDDDGGDSNITYQWYEDDVAVGGANGITYTSSPAIDGAIVVSCIATNSKGDSNEPLSTLTGQANLIRETAFSTDNPAFALDADTAWVEAQGVGGGGGGGRSNGPAGVGDTGGGGGGGASIFATFDGVANGGENAAVVVGVGGLGATTNATNGGDGTASSLSGAGLIGFSWTGGFGGQGDITGSVVGNNGGNGSTGLGGGTGGAGAEDGADGTNGGGGGGGGGSISGTEGGEGGDGSGTNGGIGGENPGGNTWISGGGGGGGGNDAVWWDAEPAGVGGEGAEAGGAATDTDATGFGNGGGGASGSNVVSPNDGGDGSDGRIILREYRQQP